MSGLAQQIATYVGAHVKGELEKLQTARSELRVFFHGPPIEYLEPALVLLTDGRISANAASGERLQLPILLQVPKLAVGQTNPPIGQSGVCDGAHLMALRNSPSCRQYLVLVPPGITQNLSITSASSEFGISAAANASNSSFELWWADGFVQVLVESSLQLFTSNQDRSEAHRLVEAGLQAAETMHFDRARDRAWRVLSRLFADRPVSIAEDPAAIVCLATGFPPAAGKLSASLAISVMDRIADELSTGFRIGADRLKQDAPEDDQVALDFFVEHVERKCELLTAFARSAPAFYSPCDEGELSEPPDWWSHLTVEKWRELLQDTEVDPREGLSFLVDSEVPVVKGGYAVVRKDAAITLRNTSGVQVDVAVQRFVGTARQAQHSWACAVDQVAVIEDTSIESHSTAIRYVASADGYRPASQKLIALESWIPAVYVSSRTASRLVPTRAAKKNRDKVALESSLQVAGPGRHYIDLYVASHATVLESATGRDAAGEEVGEDNLRARVEKVGPGRYGLELDVPGDSLLDLQIVRSPGSRPETLRVHITCDDIAPSTCGSEFERGIALNRGEGRQEVYVDRHLRRADLQSWLLDPKCCERSFVPMVLAEDYAAAWAPPNFEADFGHIYSAGKFLHDPRPPITDFSPSARFVQCRQAISARIRGPEGNGLIEEAPLGEWMHRDTGFAHLIEQYLDEYALWLSADPSTAAWTDVMLVVSKSTATKTLDQEPDAILLSPLHPVRLAWHCAAQEVLYDALQRHMPCPAATILDPDCVPDTLPLPLRMADGSIVTRAFVSVEVDSDYWSVLWNGARLGGLHRRADAAPFDSEFGIRVGGLSSAFSSAQVRRALDDTRGMFAAKSSLGVLIAGNSGATQACTQGVIEWARSVWTGDEGTADSVGRRILQVYDSRIAVEARPDDATISNLTEDTNGAVRWYWGKPKSAVPDLGIIAQLESSQPSIDERSEEKSPISSGALLRHRVRRQLPGGTFLTESRQSISPDGRADSFLNKLALAVSRLENLWAAKVSFTFAPNVAAVDELLNEQQAVLVAVSSASVDPACFLGQWLHGAYLWDYELPSFSRRAGDTNGYYLLSKLRQAERDGLGKALARLPHAGGSSTEKLHETLIEVARRGIPTVRGLSSLDSFGTGELGVFVAARLLQDEFRQNSTSPSLLPILSGDSEGRTILLVVPVDPFQNYLEDLARALKSEKRDFTYSRPDLLAVGVRIVAGKPRIRVTPIEVKCRQTGTLSIPDCLSALKQSEALAHLLAALQQRANEGGPELWTFAFQHLLLSMIAFGMRVYSQKLADGPYAREWSKLHQEIAAAVFRDSSSIELDETGRLIVVDKSTSSTHRDLDGDKFAEAITVGWDDAGEIVHGDPSRLYADIRAKVQDWRLLPLGSGANSKMGDSGAGQRDGRAEDPRSIVIDNAGAAPTTQKQPAQAGDLRAEPNSRLSEAAEPHPTRRVATPASGDGQEATSLGPADDDVDHGVLIDVGVSADSFSGALRRLNLSDTRLNQLNIGVVGDLGTGKTQLLKSIIYQLATTRANNGVKPRVLIFDYKNDYSSQEFVSAVRAKVVKPHKLPINIFDTRTLHDSMTPWLDRFSFFADVLDKIYSGIGPVQRTNLKQAVRRAYDAREGSGTPPTLVDVHGEYASLVGGRPDSPFSIIDDLIDRQVFATDANAGSFAEFFDGVVVVSLSALGQDDRAKNMVVAAMLNMFYEHMLQLPKRPFRGSSPQLRTIDSYLLVDEADNIMQYEFDVLKKILLQGREFGVGVILASQYLKHFRVNTTDYREPLLTWFVHKVPNVTPQELAALGLTAEAAELAARVKVLPNHHCLFKSAQVDGEVIVGKPFYQVIAERK